MVNAKELENETKKKSETAETTENEELKASEEEETKEAEVFESEEASEETDTSEKEDKKSFFKKKKDKKDEKIEELNDKLIRQLAEFENFRNRTEKEKAERFDMGAKAMVEKILPIVDNFERGLASVPEEDKEKPFVTGMEKIYKQMLTSLEEAGVKPMDAKGKPFDPNLHNAVMHVDDESLPENVVAEELLKGYMYKDSVVRHAMVKVAN